MQKPLNKRSFASYPPLKRTILNTKSGLLTGFLLVLFALTAIRAQAQVTFNNGRIILNNTPYNTVNTPRLPSVLPGSFDRNTGTLPLVGEANTKDQGNVTVQTVQLFYRVFQTSTAGTIAPPSFIPLNLPKAGTSGNGNGNLVTIWRNTTQPNLLEGITGTGNYTLQLFFQANATDNKGAVSSFFNGSPSVPYTTTFDVSVTPGAPSSQTVTWLGSIDKEWFTPGNWSGGVPTSTSDAIIQYASGRLNYPIIKAGTVAQVRTLTIQGQSPSEKATVTIQNGELQVFGNFEDVNGGLVELEAGLFTLAGSIGTTQRFDGGILSRVRIQGGGLKTLNNRLQISNNLEFYADGGVLRTVPGNSASYAVALQGEATISGETENSYVDGNLTAVRSFDQGQSVNTDFGGIGVTLTTGFVGTTITATRLTGFTYSSVGTQPTSVARSFSFLDLTNTSPTNFSLVFSYLNRELNTNPTANLKIYSFPNTATGFSLLGTSALRPNKSVVVSNVTSSLASTFTLGSNTTPTPLPVTLVSFTAAPTAQGAALLRWTTATETNNKGFGIERQLASGDTWQSVGYLASGNNATGGTYEYTDKSLSNAAFTPQAYYRLRQEDQDGKLSYSPVAVVARPAVVASTNLLLSPVPVTGASISLTFAEAGQAGSEISITNTQGQRLYNYTTQASTDTALSLPVERLAAGVYIVSVRVPGQALRHARFVKL
jgi:hypothetical protein